MKFGFWLTPSRLFSALILLLGAVSCSDKDSAQEKLYTIGFSQCTDDMWRQIMMIQMESESTKYPIRLLINDAQNDNSTQIAQIERFIEQKVDLLVISPNESAPITEVAVKAFNRGIPTIIWDRKIESDRYTTYISADNYAIGRDVGKYVKSILPEGSSILEICGLKGSSPAQERHKGFTDVVSDKYRISQVEGDWKPEIAQNATAGLGDFSNIDLVFGHNDDMALAAYDAIAAADSAAAKRIKFLGIDAIVGVDAVIDGRLDASFLYPPGGEFVIQTAMKILRGEKVDKIYTLTSSRIDKSNAETLKSQSQQILSYQNHINYQRKQLDDIIDKSQSLHRSLTILGIVALLFVLLSLFAFFSYLKTRKENRSLEKRNAEIGQETVRLLHKNEEIEKLTEQKLGFFVNMSHEVRTPLTLILSPLSKLISNEKDKSITKDLLIIQKNATHLLKIINQIMDFSKVENKKSSLSVREVDIVSFTNEILKYFEAYASNERLVCKFASDIPSQLLWIDTDKIEQILINLISNAFKNSKKYGVITVSIKDNTESVIIEVHDNGKGIKPEDLSHIFDRYFTTGKHNGQGTGIGLNLSKDYVEMHGGRIFATSIEGQCTSFYIELPKGSAHLPADAVKETILPPTNSEINHESVDKLMERHYDETILIAEDDENIRQYLQEELSANFNVMTAADGYEAIHMVMDNDISLVISDVLMPRINGFQLCKSLKTDIATSHIPIVLLTALTDDSQKIYGIAEGADEYIQKPFNIEYLKVKAMRILEEREKLLNSFAKDFAGHKEFQSIPTADNAFRDKLAEILERSYSDSDFRIENLSQDLNISRVQLLRKIKTLFGMTPTDMLRNYRLNKALEILQNNSGITISEVAYSSGFSSPAYFTRCFKAKFGKTPTTTSRKRS